MQNVQTIFESARALHVPPVAENEISEDGLAVSEREYWDKYYNHPDFSYEWNNGRLEAKPMSDLRGSQICQWFQNLLYDYFRKHPIGVIVNLEIGFSLELPDKTSIRKPDMAVVLGKNPMPMYPSDCSYSGVFDLCVESLSYSSTKEVRRDTVVKKGEYEGVGVREYYILDARKIETAFYRLNRRGKYERIRPSAGGVVRSGVLPGFQFRVSDLYRQPSFEELVEDGVYQEYVLPFHQRVKQRAEQERQRAEQEKQRAEQERQRAEQEKQRAEQEKQRAEQEKQRAEQEKQRAEHAEKKLAVERRHTEQERQRAEQERQRAEQERQKAERLAAQLEALGISPE
jgi:hypothetical protein